MDRKARSDLHRRRSRITRRSGSTEAVEFFNVLNSAELLETTEALLPVHREHAARSSTGQQGRAVAVVRAALERRVGTAQSEDHHRHGRSALPDAIDERQAVVGSPAGLQRDPMAHAIGRQQRRRGSAQPELQAHRATVDAVGGVRSVRYARQWVAVRVDRAMPSRSSARAHRAANAKTKAKTLPLAQDAQGSRSQASSALRPCVGDKVSAIRLRGVLRLRTG